MLIMQESMLRVKIPIRNASGKNTHPGRFSDEQLISLQKHAREVIERAKAEGMDFPYERAEEYLSKILDV